MLERLARHEYYYFLDGYLSYNQIAIALEDQEKKTSSHVSSEHMHTDACRLVYTMLQPPSNDV